MSIREPDLICLPCKKEIINSRAAGANAVSEVIAVGIVTAVKSNRMDQAVADSLLADLIAADEDYIAAVAAIEADYLGKVKPVW